MGRTEAPLERDGTAAMELAFWLRELRRGADLTYPEIATITNYAASSLQGACSGRRLPSKKITLAIVAACHGDLPAWSAYWSQLRRLGLEPGAEVRPPWSCPPDPAEVAQPADPPGGDAVRATDIRPVAPADPAQPGESATAVAGTDDDLPPFMDRSQPARPVGRHRLGWLGSIAASFAVGILVGHQYLRASPAVSRDAAAPVTSSWARESGKDGAPSLADPRDHAGPGPGVPYGQPVQLACELRVGDNDWYLVASRPWQNRYYAPAADFATASAQPTVSVPTC